MFYKSEQGSQHVLSVLQQNDSFLGSEDRVHILNDFSINKAQSVVPIRSIKATLQPPNLELTTENTFVIANFYFKCAVVLLP